jgi:uncharacterized protein (DUF2236 family)
MMPSREEAAELVPPPDGVTWRIAGDARLFAGSGYALLLQVAHPSVGAGVTQHSNFKGDPWGRLLRTLDYTSAMVYGGPDLAWEVGRRIREMHSRIKGVRPDGTRYRALDPRPYAWVHASLAEAIVHGHRLYCGALGDDDVTSFWSEWRRMGQLVGVGKDDLPETWQGLRSYFHDMVERELGRTEAADDVLAALLSPAAPSKPWMPPVVWRVVRMPPAKATWLTTLGMLPGTLRERLGVAWRVDRELRFRMLARMIRLSAPVLPPQARSFGPHYLRWRRGASALSERGSGGGRLHPRTGARPVAPA